MGQQSLGTTYTSIINGFIFSSDSFLTLPNAPWAYPALKFKETLKVEIKRSGQQTTSAQYNYVGVRHAMI